MKLHDITLLTVLSLMVVAAPCAEEKPRPPSTVEGSAASREAIAAMKLRDWTAARTAWEEAIKLEPENAAAWSNCGKVLFRLGEDEAAVTHLEKAVTLRPSLGDTWIALGMVYEKSGAPMRAISCLTRAVHENPLDPSAHNALAIMMKRVGWTGAAESELQKALDLEPKFGDAHFNLAVMYLERQPPSLEMAKRHYNAAVELGADPDADLERQLAGEDVMVDEVEVRDVGGQKDPVSEPAKKDVPPDIKPADKVEKKGTTTAKPKKKS